MMTTIRSFFGVALGALCLVMVMHCTSPNPTQERPEANNEMNAKDGSSTEKVATEQPKEGTLTEKVATEQPKDELKDESHTEKMATEQPKEGPLEKMATEQPKESAAGISCGSSTCTSSKELCHSTMPGICPPNPVPAGGCPAGCTRTQCQNRETCMCPSYSCVEKPAGCSDCECVTKSKTIWHHCQCTQESGTFRLSCPGA